MASMLYLKVFSTSLSSSSFLSQRERGLGRGEGMPVREGWGRQRVEERGQPALTDSIVDSLISDLPIIQFIITSRFFRLAWVLNLFVGCVTWHFSQDSTTET